MADPIVQRLPDTQKALENKYSTLPNFDSISPPIRNALLDLDLQRANRGQNPISARQTQLALQAILSNQAQTPVPKSKGLVGDFISDLTTITRSIPRLPVALYREVQELPTAGEKISEGLSSSGNMLDKLSAVASAPGVRLLPGAFIAGNLNNPSELVNHPLYTLLDVLPGKEIPAVNRQLSRAGTNLREVTTPVRDAVRTSKPGQVVSETFGRQSRDLAQVESELSGQFRERLSGTRKDNPVAILADQINQLRSKIPDEARRVELTRIMQEDADQIRSLTGEDLSFVNDVRDLTDKLADYTVSEGLLERIGGEVYDLPTAAKVINGKTPPPARYTPKIEKEINEQVKVQLSDRPDFDTILPYLREHNYGWLAENNILSKRDFERIQSDVKSSWQELKASGYDPIFVHRLSPNQIGQLNFPRVLEHITTPTQVKARTHNYTPSVDDVTVSLSHQAMELLRKKGTEEFIDEIGTRWGKTQQSLIDQYLPAARVAAKGVDSRVLGEAQRLMEKEWTPYTPDAIFTFPSARIKRWGGEDVWIPKTLANNIQRLHTPPGGRLTTLTDPIMKVFRTALLPLSPRWHVYNMLGGGIMLTTSTSPEVWKYLNQARNMVKSGEIPDHVPKGMGIVQETLDWNRVPLSQRLNAVYSYMGGKTQSRLLDEVGSAGEKVGDAFRTVVQKSYDGNSFVDDMYRTMAYLYGHDKSLTKGMTTEAAQKAGVELARKVMQNWDRMTPIERSIMRYVFPFYGWMSHVLRFVYNYPIDHPIRTSVTAAFARNELEDMGDGLPERFLNSFFLGKMDDKGNVKTLNLAGLNPFSDVSNYFSLSGLLGQTNPIISSLLESVGIDPTSGNAELFPTLRYDKETGRLSAQDKNPLAILAQNILPQSQVLLGLADSSSEFQQLMRTNPEAAGRLLVSQAGLPIIMRTVNQPQEIAKAEISRDEAQSTALNEALKTGNYDRAKGFENLRPILDAISKLQSEGKLEEFTPLSPGQSAIGVAQRALLANFGR